jgi:ethanolamine utilization protein EutN
MKLGRIVGTVVASRKDEKIESLRLYVVRDVSVALANKDSFVVAVDAVGAGVGELVLYASGSSARQTRATEGRPVDATIMAIVDQVDLEGQLVYDKHTEAKAEIARRNAAFEATAGQTAGEGEG